MRKRLVVGIDYMPSEPQAPANLTIKETGARSPVTIKRSGNKSDPVFYITVRPDINVEADKALKMLLHILDPENSMCPAHEGICLVLEAVFFAGLEFAKKHPDQVNT